MLQLDDVALTQDGFSLSLSGTVEPGARVAVLGPSGSGKSTLLALIAGFERPDRGRILWNGADITGDSVARRPVSILFQDGNLFPHLTVFDNVALGLRPDLRLSPHQRDRVAQSLSDVGLGDFGDRRPATLSGGQQARVGLLDEPFAALDPGLRAEMLALLKSLSERRGLTLIMACHDLRDAERLCDRLWMLEEGKLVLDAPMAGLRDAPPCGLMPWL
jgi:thiamine transport system ATP-binding protein